jgi:hypothetical protein
MQMHKYDKSTLGNNYLAVSRLLRARGVGGMAALLRYARAKNVLCFQTYFKMEAAATVELDSSQAARLNAAALFAEAKAREPYFRAKLQTVYADVFAMKSDLLHYEACVPGGPAISRHYF